MFDTPGFETLSSDARLLLLVVGRYPELTRAELDRWTGLPLPRLKAAAQVLMRRGLIEKAGDGVRRLVPVPAATPESALALADRRVQVKGLPTGFVRLWRIYPRDDNRKAALKAYLRLNPTDDAALTDEWVAAIERQVLAWRAQGRTIDKVPHLSSWLNGERWNDSLDTKALGRPMVSAANLEAAEGAYRLIQEKFGT